MIYLSDLKKINNNKYAVGFIHYMPFDKDSGLKKTKNELESKGVLVEELDDPKCVAGKTPILYCNPSTKKVWYEYEDIPKTEEELQQEKIQALEQSIAELSATIAILQTPEK